MYFVCVIVLTYRYICVQSVNTNGLMSRVVWQHLELPIALLELR
jgi:hypothetical protein